jgi:uncharacterized protein (TIGR00369 family)
VSTERKKKLLALFGERGRLSQHLGLTLFFDNQDRAIVTLPYNPNLDHSMGAIHGGVISTLLDVAGWFTCAVRHEGNGWVVTTEMNVHFLRPAMKTELVAKGEILKTGQRQDVAEMRCTDSSGNLIAHATGTFVYLEHVPIQEVGPES